MRDRRSRPGRFWRPGAAALFASAAVIGGCGGGDDKQAADRPFQPATTTAPAVAQPAPGTVTTPDGTARKATIADARKAVDDDKYAAAEQTFPALTAAERKSVRERVANRLAKKAKAALKKGNASTAESALAQAKKYPETDLVEQVRDDYEAAVKAAASDRAQRLLDAQREARERRQRRRAQRAADLARKTQEAKQQP